MMSQYQLEITDPFQRNENRGTGQSWIIQKADRDLLTPEWVSQSLTPSSGAVVLLVFLGISDSSPGHQGASRRHPLQDGMARAVSGGTQYHLF